MKYKVLKKSPANQVKIMKKLSPSTLLFLWLLNSWGKPNVASIDMEANPRIVP